MKYRKQMKNNFINGNLIINNEFKFSLIFRSISVVHLTLFAIFLWLKVYPLVFFNVVSVLLYNLLVVLCRKNKIVAAFHFTYVEIFLHTLVANILIGYRFGFQLYTLALIPVSFYVAFTLERFKNKIIVPFEYAILSMIVFVSCKIWDMNVGSIYRIEDHNQEMIIYIFNAVVCYMMIIIFSVLFLFEIYQFQYKLKQANCKLERLAGVDPLTGLLNRRKFYEQIREKKEEITYVLLCDVDDFKRVNDNYGHECGDSMLVEIAGAFTQNFAEPNLVCRWGGEEICVAGMGNRESILRKAEKLRLDIENIRVDYEGNSVQATITIGVAECKGISNLKDAISEADQKMYEGKQNGKNRVVC